MTTCIGEISPVMGTVIAIDAAGVVGRTGLMNVIFERAGPRGPA